MGVETSEQNGINLNYVQGAIEGITRQPESAVVVSRTRHRWDDGFAVDGKVDSLEQGGNVTVRRHTFRTDWPEPFGADSGPTPGVESILGAVGACIATTYIIKAAMRGVAIEELEVVSEGRLDLQGLFEVGDSVPARFSKIDVKVRVHSSAQSAVLEELGAVCTRTSPTFDSLANPVPIRLSVERLS